MNTPVINATTSGLAFRVSILGGQHEAYEGVYAKLEPQPRIAPFGAAAFDRMSEHAQRMAEGMSRAFGPE